MGGSRGDPSWNKKLYLVRLLPQSIPRSFFDSLLSPTDMIQQRNTSFSLARCYFATFQAHPQQEEKRETIDESENIDSSHMSILTQRCRPKHSIQSIVRGYFYCFCWTCTDMMMLEIIETLIMTEIEKAELFYPTTGLNLTLLAKLMVIISRR